ncbi:UNVERIFIED_CONTAM: hypothetical protein FKN15_055004 [Acipenser sinensis]
MGKNHKRHKSEKHAYEEYAEKPLKLVLKVGGSEVTELSTASSGHDCSMFEDKSDHDKDKKKKKKCEKDKPLLVPEVQEKKKKAIENSVSCSIISV